MFSIFRRKATAKTKTPSFKDPSEALAAGDLDSAITLYRRLAKRQPRRAATWHKKAAEILQRADRPDEAIEEFLASAHHFEREGLTLKAIAIYKAILRLDPGNSRVGELLGELSRDGFETLTGPEASGQMTIRTRLRKYAPLFSEFDKETLAAVVDVMQTHHFETGQIVFEQGDSGDSLFIIAEGEIALTTTDADGQAVELERLTDNECFGELSALSRVPRNMTAITTRPSEVLELARDYLEAVAITHPQIWSVLESYQQRRLIPAGSS